MADALTSANARKAALTRWDGESDRYKATQAMRDGFPAKLRAQVLEEHPGLTDEAEIQNRVIRKLKLHYETMRANSLKSRRAKAAAKRQAALDALTEAIASVEAAEDESADADTTAA